MSHGLGTSLGLIMGAKLARPEHMCVNFMGDAAFGMVGLDFETAVRHQIPIMTLVLNNSGMASEVRDMPYAEATYATATWVATTRRSPVHWADTPSAWSTQTRSDPRCCARPG